MLGSDPRMRRSSRSLVRSGPTPASPVPHRSRAELGQEVPALLLIGRHVAGPLFAGSPLARTLEVVQTSAMSQTGSCPPRRGTKGRGPLQLQSHRDHELSRSATALVLQTYSKTSRARLCSPRRWGCGPLGVRKIRASLTRIGLKAHVVVEPQSQQRRIPRLGQSMSSLASLLLDG